MGYESGRSIMINFPARAAGRPMRKVVFDPLRLLFIKVDIFIVLNQACHISGRSLLIIIIMPKLINLATFTDARGNLTVLEKVLPFSIKRAFFIYGVDSSKRGGHRHNTTIQAAICIQGSCRIYSNNGMNESYHHLDSPSKCLIIDAEDWHIMDRFTPNAILMVFASTYFTEDDYILEPYLKTSHSTKQPINS
jgi:hypothetical protein